MIIDSRKKTFSLSPSLHFISASHCTFARFAFSQQPIGMNEFGATRNVFFCSLRRKISLTCASE